MEDWSGVIDILCSWIGKDLASARMLMRKKIMCTSIERIVYLNGLVVKASQNK
jgi:hypothetical protein